MSIRLRVVDGGTDMERYVALCANEVDARDGDIYLHDGFHQVLADKFWSDWSSSGIIPCPKKVHDATEPEPCGTCEGSGQLLNREKAVQRGVSYEDSIYPCPECNTCKTCKGNKRAGKRGMKECGWPCPDCQGEE